MWKLLSPAVTLSPGRRLLQPLSPDFERCYSGPCDMSARDRPARWVRRF